MLKILIVEDDSEFQSILSEFFLRRNKNGTKIDIADSYADAFLRLTTNAEMYDLVIIDYYLKGNLNGLFLYKEIVKKNLCTPVLMLSGISVQEFVLATKKEKTVPKFLSKPFSLIEFEAVISGLNHSQNSIFKIAG